MRRVYKVLSVTRKNGKVTERRSAMHYNRRYQAAGISLGYKVRSVNYPKVGKLFAFSTLEDARYFAASFGNYEIWKATTTSTKRTIMILSDSENALISFLEEFWSEEISGDIRLMSAPSGTVLCPNIKLVECVYSG